MKPNFALNLSHDGISLLHRAKTGWLSVGEVALNDPELDAKLHLLRRTAADLENGGLTSKLVIPNSQILYTEIDVPGIDTAARISQIRDGLVGLTPYDVSDLVFDWRLQGKRAHVAVVSRDTLREAEGFATQYRFNPISFVAVPVDGAFDGEPFFGPTQHAANLLTDGESIEPDKQQIRILGQVATPAPAAESPTPPSTPKPDPRPESPPKAGTVPPPPVAEPEKAASDTAPLALAAAPKDTPAKPSADAGADVAAVAFASRRKVGTAELAPATGLIRSEPRFTLGADRSPSPTGGVTAATLDMDAPDRVNGIARNTPAFDIPGETRDDANPALYASPKIDAKPVADDKPATSPHAKPISATNADATGPDRTPMSMTSPHTADVVDPGDKAAEKRRLAREKAQMGKAALIGTLSKLGRGKVESAKPTHKPTDSLSPRATEAEAMTIFGARGMASQNGKPRFLGLMLTLMLLLALAVMALWSTYFMPNVASGLFGTAEKDPVASAPADISQPDAIVPDPQPEATASSPPDSAAAPLTDTAQSPIDVAVESALTELTATEPAQPEPAQPDELALLNDPAVTVVDPLPEPLPEPLPDPIAEPLPEIAALPDTAGTVAEPIAEPEIPQVAEPIISTAERQPPPTPAEAEARYAATGIWQLDPEPLGDAPGGGDQLEDVYVASIDPVISATDAFALPGVGTLDTDQLPPATNAPAPLGTRYDFDERGLVRATPEGALTPDGVPVFTGAPSVVPGPRPADLKVPLDETRLLLDERLQDRPPEVRPGGLSESNERARLGGFSSTELAAIRPSIRPLSLQQPRETVFAAPETETESASIDPVIIGSNATEFAVAVSRAPPVRPSNFSNVVNRALREATTAEPREKPKPEILASVAVAAPRMPSVPTRASVAKQATVRNAINLGKINLIGVYGSPAKRRALVRLSSGKYVKVEVGDRVDGGRVAAISDGELRYVKSGRNITLSMPKG